MIKFVQMQATVFLGSFFPDTFYPGPYNICCRSVFFCCVNCRLLRTKNEALVNKQLVDLLKSVVYFYCLRTR